MCGPTTFHQQEEWTSVPVWISCNPTNRPLVLLFRKVEFGGNRYNSKKRTRFILYQPHRICLLSCWDSMVQILKLQWCYNAKSLYCHILPLFAVTVSIRVLNTNKLPHCSHTILKSTGDFIKVLNSSERNMSEGEVWGELVMILHGGAKCL
jgi:hypothetical protein